VIPPKPSKFESDDVDTGLDETKIGWMKQAFPSASGAIDELKAQRVGTMDPRMRNTLNLAKLGLGVLQDIGTMEGRGYMGLFSESQKFGDAEAGWTKGGRERLTAETANMREELLQEIEANPTLKNQIAKRFKIGIDEVANVVWQTFASFADSPISFLATIPLRSVEFAGKSGKLAAKGVSSFSGKTQSALGTLLGLGTKAGAVTVATAADVIAGTRGARDVLEGTTKGVKAVAQRKAAAVDEMLNPKVMPDAKDVEAVAVRAGIDPADIEATNSLKFGKLSEQAREQQVAAQGKGGGVELERHNRVTEAVQTAYNDGIANIGGGVVHAAPEAGKAIREGVFDGLKRLDDEITLTHADIIAENPALMVTKGERKIVEDQLTAIERFATGREMRGISPAQRAEAKKLLEAANAVRASNFSYKQLNEAREMVGEVAFEMVGSAEKIPKYEKMLRDLYFSVNESLFGTVRRLDNVKRGQFRPKGAPNYTEMADQLAESNKIISEAMRSKGVLTKGLGDAQTAGEEIFRNLVVNGNTSKIKALKRFLTPEELQQVKASYLEHLTKRDVNGYFTYRQTANALRTHKDKLAELFDDPKELQGVMEFLRLGDRVGSPLLPGSAGQHSFGVMGKLFEPVEEAAKASVTETGIARTRPRVVTPSLLKGAKRVAIGPETQIGGKVARSGGEK
jgi:hypothetical protein